MAGREYEAVAIRPFRILRVEVHELGEKDVGHGGGAEWQTGMAGVGGLDRVDGEDAQGVDGFGFELAIERGGSDGGQENLLERRRGERKRHAAGALRQAGGGVSPVTGKYPMSRPTAKRRWAPSRGSLRNEHIRDGKVVMV